MVAKDRRMCMKRKIWAVLLSICTLAMLFTGCGSSSSSDSDSKDSDGKEEKSEGMAVEDVKVGVIYIGDENDAYSLSHMNGIDDMQEALGLSDDQILEKTTIPEDEQCYDAAVDLADNGCNIIFSTSFGHEDFLVQAAEEYPDVIFCAVSGYQASSSGLDNMFNMYTKISEARYVSGVVAGLKVQEMIDNGEVKADEAKLGYVGAFPYAEVISGFTAFYLGAKSVCSDVTMEVIYTNSWGDTTREAEAAKALIANHCVLLSQQANTTGCPTTCEEAGVPVVGYNIDMRSVAKTCALTSPTNYWGVCYTAFVQSVIDGEDIPVDQSFGLADGAVGITELGDACAEGTEDKVEETIAGISDGTIKIFDLSTFTIGGKTLDELDYKVNDTDYSQFCHDGGFFEGEVQSTPAFDIMIDGITADE